MKKYPKIWFLRHGQTEWNKASRLQGQLDSPLTAQGRAEASRQAQLMPDILAQDPPIWVSPLGRALETARIALGGAPFQTDPRLKEIDAGRWEGQNRQDIKARYPEFMTSKATALDLYGAADGGEGLDAFRSRIVAFVEDLRGPTVVVAHGLLGQVMRAHLRGLPWAQAGTLSNLQGVVYVIENGTEEVLRPPE